MHNIALLILLFRGIIMIQMISEFQILKSYDGIFKPLKYDINKHGLVTPGGFYFKIGCKLIPFDFEAFACQPTDSGFIYESGYGLMFNSFELDDCYDDMLKEIGLNRKDIDAKLLASVESIDEFHVYFTDDNKDISISSNSSESDYRINLYKISFFDGNSVYEVRDNVLNRFNTSMS